MHDPWTPPGHEPSVTAPRRGFGWVTFLQILLLIVVGGIAGYAAVQAIKARRAPPQTGAGAGRSVSAARGSRSFATRGMPRPDRKIVSAFDTNGDKRLDAVERAAARESLRNEGPAGGSGRRGGFRRRDFSSGPPRPGLRLTPRDVRPYPGAPVYDLRILRTIFLTFERDDWEQELAAFYGTDVEVPAAVLVDGTVYRDVGVHFRGNSSYRMVPAGYKHSLNLSFDFVNPNQQLGEYRTLNLINANEDATFVRTVLYSEIARNYLPVPLTSFVRVAINGESWGVFVSVQQFDKEFLRDWFKSTKGARWKTPGSPRGRAGLQYLGEEAAPYKSIYEIKTKDEAQSWAALINLCRVLNQTPAEKLQRALEPILDIDTALKFLALEAALVNSDGYWTRASDYSLYLDDRARFHVLPLDFNEALGAGRSFGGGGPDLDPLTGLDDASKPLRSKLLAVPVLRERYLGYVRDIARRWLDWNRIGPLVRQWQALIESDIKADTRKLYSTDAFHADVGADYEDGNPAPENTLRGFVERRREFLLK
jgi:CotH kinase protein